MSSGWPGSASSSWSAVAYVARPSIGALWAAYAAASFTLVGLPGLGLLLPALVLIGVTVGAIDPLERAVRQERTPAHLRGRVFSAMYAVPKVAAPLGVFSAGLLIELAGLRGGLLAFAIGNALIAVTLLFIRGVGSLDWSPASSSGRMAETS